MVFERIRTVAGRRVEAVVKLSSVAALASDVVTVPLPYPPLPLSQLPLLPPGCELDDEEDESSASDSFADSNIATIASAASSTRMPLIPRSLNLTASGNAAPSFSVVQKRRQGGLCTSVTFTGSDFASPRLRQTAKQRFGRHQPLSPRPLQAQFVGQASSVDQLSQGF